LFQAFSSFSRLLPHSTKHVGAPKPVPIYLSGRSPSPLNKDESNDDENDGEEDEQKISSQISHLTPTIPTPNYFTFMNNWVNATSSSASINPVLLNASSSAPSTSTIINFSHGNDDIPNMSSMISSSATNPKVCAYN